MLRVISTDHIEPATADQPERLRSNAFHDNTSPVSLAEKGYPAPAASVAVEKLLDADGTTAEEVLEKEWDSSYGVVRLSVAIVRAEGQGIHLDPTKDNPAHALLFTLSGSHRTKGKARALSRDATIVRQPR